MTNLLGVIIAGGQSRRFNDDAQNTDKFMAPFGKTTLLGHIIERAKKQTSSLILNVNGDVARVESFGLDVIKDNYQDGGPLGGILIAMTAARKKGYSHIMTFSCDSPFFPDDYGQRLTSEKDAKIVISKSGDKFHPVMGVFDVSLCDDLKAYLESGERRVLWWIKRHSFKEVIWDVKDVDPFFNINTRQELAIAEKFL